MERRRITCPESAHLEEVELEPTPLGRVVVSCSRFSPHCEVTCARECTARMDRRERRDTAELRERVLVLCGHDDADMQGAAEQLAEALRRDDFVVEIARADSAPPPQDYEAVVVASTVRRRRLPRATTDYLNVHRDSLAAMPTYYLSVSARAEDIAALATRIADEMPAIDR